MSIFTTLSFIANHPLNRSNRAAALLGFLKWQIGARLIPGQVLYDWINGARLIVRPGETGLTGNVYCGLHEFPDMAYLLHVLGPDDLFVDVGANVGSYTVLACAAKGATGYCLEPVPSTYARLLDNIRINDLQGRVKAFNVGLADAESELTFTSGQNCTNHVVADSEQSSQVVRVKVLPLDSIMEGEKPSMLKIDVEGFETAVLKGADATLKRASLHSVIMELNGSGERYGFDERRILDTMRGYGFGTYSYDPFSRALTSLDGKNSRSGNTLFIRGEELIRTKLKMASEVSVRGIQM